MPLGAGVLGRGGAGWEGVTGTRTGLSVLEILTRPSSFWKQEGQENPQCRAEEGQLCLLTAPPDEGKGE